MTACLRGIRCPVPWYAGGRVPGKRATKSRRHQGHLPVMQSAGRAGSFLNAGVAPPHQWSFSNRQPENASLEIRVASPTFDEHLRFQQRVEHLAGQQLVAQLSVEALDATVFPRTPWFDEQR